MGSQKPLVSCIMPTYNRRPFVSRAIHFYLRQDYPRKELIIVDDGTDPVGDLVPQNPSIRYVRLPGKATIGAKRNLACADAQGEIVCHWDDDDWSAPRRIRYQVDNLLSQRADICGLEQVRFFKPDSREAWDYIYPRGWKRDWVCGGTLCYTKAFWEKHPFGDLNEGEDTQFVWADQSARVLSLSDKSFYIAVIHSANTSPKRTDGGQWKPQSADETVGWMGPDWNLFGNGVRVDAPAHRPTRNGSLAVACAADLGLIEFEAFNHGRRLQRMRRWELPYALFESRLPNTGAALDCTINPVNFGERLSQLYRHVLYRHWNPIRNGRFQLPAGFPDEAFDRVFCINTLEHLLKEQREALVESLARKLKPGGWLILTSDYYFDSMWREPKLLRAGVMRADRGEVFNGWNKITQQDWLELCRPHGLTPLADPGAVQDPIQGDGSLYLNQEPYAHATIGGVFQKGDGEVPAGRRIALALLTFNTVGPSLASFQALLREARMLQRLGQQPIIVLCDNGSDDGTADALRGLQKNLDVPSRFIFNPDNRGNSKARNQIIDCALEEAADYVLLMDGDIEVVPFSSFAMLRHMEDWGRELGAVGPEFMGQNPERKKVAPCLYSLSDCRIGVSRVYAWTQYGLFRREVFESGVRFEESPPFDGPGWGFEDNDLAFQMHLKGFHIHHFTGMTYLHRSTHSSIPVLLKQGIDARELFYRRKQFVIDKWSGVASIDPGPLETVRKCEIQR